MAQQHKPLLVRRQFYDNDRSVEDAMLVQLSRDKVRGPTPWGESYVAPAIRPFVLMPEVWELNTNRAISTADRTRRQLDFEMTAHGDLLMSLTLRAKAPDLGSAAESASGRVAYPPALILALIHRAELWVGHTLVERLEPEYIHIWQRLACRTQPKEAQARVGDQSHHDPQPLDQYVVLPFFFHRGQAPLPIQKVRDNCGGRLGGPEGGIRVRVYLRDISEICPRLSRDPANSAVPPAAPANYDDFQFQLIGRTALLGDDEARHVRKADFSTVVPHVESLHQDEDGTVMRESPQITELPLRVERPVTRLIWAVRDKHVLPDAQGNHTYAQGVRKLAGPPVQPLLGDFNVLREGSSPSSVPVPTQITTNTSGVDVGGGANADFPNNGGARIFDNNVSTDYVIYQTANPANPPSSSNPYLLNYDHGAPVVLNRYRLFRNVLEFPTKWTLQASNDDVTYVTIDTTFENANLVTPPNYQGSTDSNDPLNVAAADQSDDFNAGNVAYRYYRWAFVGTTDNDGNVNEVKIVEIQLFTVAGAPGGSTDLKTSRLDMRPGSLHLWGDRFDFRTTDEQGVELADPIEDVQLKLDGQDRLPDDSNMRAAYFRLVDPHEHASRSQGQQPGVYSYTFARHADSLSRADPLTSRAVTGSINLGKVHDKVLRLRHRVRDREAVLFVWAECLNVFEMGSGYGSYGMRYA
jgi:hypothetical protein